MGREQSSRTNRKSLPGPPVNGMINGEGVEINTDTCGWKTTKKNKKWG